MGTNAKIAAAAAVVLGAGFAAYGWMNVGANERVLEVIASSEVLARVRRCGCQGEANHPFAPGKLGTCSCKNKGRINAAAPGSKDIAADLGALPERSVWQRALGGDPLVVDAGDLLFPHLGPMDYERPEWQRRAELIVEVMDRLHLRAFAPGETDLALGRAALEALAGRAKFAFVSANLKDAKTHLPVFKTRTSVVKSGVRVGVVGVFDPPRTDEITALLAKEGLEVTDAVAAVKVEAAALREEGCEVVLLVAHAPDPVARAIVKAVPGIELAVHSHPEIESNASSSFEDGAVVATTWPGGGLPLRLTLNLVPGATKVVERDFMNEARTWIDRVRTQLESQIREREKATGDAARELDQQIAMVSAKLREREATLPKEPHHEASAAIVALGATFFKKGGADPEILAAIERFKSDVEKLGLDPEVAKKIEAPGVTAKGRPDAFAGAATCVTCHKLQAETWAASKHSTAWSSLEKSESQKDPSCVGCHSIGFRKPGGFAEPRRAEHDGRNYRNVQCESCHGARLSHTEDPRGAGVGIRLPKIEDCRKCHDGEHDPSFDVKRFEKALESKICVKGLP